MEKLLNEALGWSGHIVSGSKSGYRENHPDHVVVFNANVCTNSGKVWWGDVDLTISKEALSEVSIETGETIYVLYEMDGRFENENSPLIGLAVAKFLPDGSVELREDLKKYYSL